MKLNVLSDLHLSFEPFRRPINDADVVILAGDIARPREAVAWALGFDKPVLYVAGNHEFYGGSIDAASAELERLCRGTHVHVLDDSEIVIDGFASWVRRCGPISNCSASVNASRWRWPRRAVCCATSAASGFVNQRVPS